MSAPPPGRTPTIAAWLLIATLAHNLLRWAALLCLGTAGKLLVAKTLWRTLLGCRGG